MYRLPWSFLAAFWAVCSTVSLVGPETDSVVMSNSFYSLLCFCAFAGLIRHSFSQVEKKNLILPAAMAFLFSLCIVLGTDMRISGNISFTVGAAVKKTLQAAGLSFPATALLLTGMTYFPRAGQKAARNQIFQKMECCSLLTGKRFFFLSWVVIFFCWLPAFLAYYPGIFAYDVPRQVVQAVEHTYSTHHPLIHTLYLNGSLWLGKRLTGAYGPGVAFYTITQMGILSACFAFFCYMTGKKRLPAALRVLAAAFFSLNPVIHLMAVSATKDTLFAGWMLVCAVFLWDMAGTPEDFFEKKRNSLFLAVSAALMMLFRNNGMYAFLVMSAVWLTAQKNFRKPALATILGAFLLYQGAARLMVSACDATPGSIAEMLSIPLQQIARTLQYEPDTVSEEERNTFYEIIPEQAAAQYYDHLADLVKSDFNEEAFRKNPARYLRLWLSLGKKHPGCYLNAFFATTLGYWYPDDIFHAYIYAARRHGYLMTAHMGEIVNTGDPVIVEKQSFLPWLEELYEQIATWNQHQKIPVISMWFSPGFHCWLLLFTLGLCAGQKKKRSMAVVFALPFGLWLTLLLSPAVLMRYVFPITLFQPLILFEWMEVVPEWTGLQS